MFSEDYISRELMNQIGRSVGLKMWDDRDKSKTYSYPGGRGDEDLRADDYCNGKITEWKDIPLLTFLEQSMPNCGRGGSSMYTINLNTLKPTRSSPNQTQLTEQMKKDIQEYKERMRQQENGGRVSTTKIIGVVLPRSGKLGWAAAEAKAACAAVDQIKLMGDPPI